MIKYFLLVLVVPQYCTGESATSIVTNASTESIQFQSQDGASPTKQTLPVSQVLSVSQTSSISQATSNGPEAPNEIEVSYESKPPVRYEAPNRNRISHRNKTPLRGEATHGSKSPHGSKAPYEIAVPHGNSTILPVDVNDTNFVVNIHIREKHACVGAYIRPLWVLTTGSCVQGKSKTEILVYMATSQAGCEEEGEVSEVEGLYTYESFHKKPIEFDVGLIMLSRFFEFKSDIGLLATAREVSYENGTCTLIGWGLSNADIPPTRLASTKIELVNPEECAQIYSKEKKRVHHTEICAQSSNAICKVSPGSLLVCDSAITGLASNIPGCGDPKPGLFTNVPFFYDWMENYFRKEKILLEPRQAVDTAPFHIVDSIVISLTAMISWFIIHI